MVEIFHSDQVNFPAEVETQVITVNVVKEIFQLEVKIHSEQTWNTYNLTEGL